jgi:hypothetical protein
MKMPIIFLYLFLPHLLSAQQIVSDRSMRYQQERMVFKQWDQNKFTPRPGFLGLNPYYWLVWGLFYPNYHKTDLRPLSATGPQTQRLGLVASMNALDNKYKLHSDTLRNTALSQIAEQAGLVSGADPLWTLYYRGEFQPVLNSSAVTILGGLPLQVIHKLISEGLYSWYKNELDMLRERIQGARTANMERGSRILAYYRLLKEYRVLSGIWAIRITSAQKTIQMAAQQQKLKANQVTADKWTPQTDVRIALQVLQNRKY